MKNQPETSFSQPEAVRKHFEDHSDAWPSVYDEQNIHAQNIQTRRERVLKYVDRLDLPEGSAALDLGCGAGLVCADLLGRGYRVSGLDAAQNMIDLAQKHCAEAGCTSGIALQVGDAEALEFEDDTFDLIIAMGLVEYITWDRWALQEMHRVLKPGGHLIVTAPNRVRISELVHPLRWMRRGIRSLQKKILRKIAPSTSSNKKSAHHPRKNSSGTCIAPPNLTGCWRDWITRYWPPTHMVSVLFPCCSAQIHGPSARMPSCKIWPDGNGSLICIGSAATTTCCAERGKILRNLEENPFS